MFQIIRNWLDHRIIQRSSIASAQWTEAFALLPLLERLTDSEKRALSKLAILFLDQKVIQGADGLTITQAMTLIIALQACLPILKLGLDGYDGWTSVIVYPAGFAPKREIMDQYGVVHQVQSSLSGEAWQRGPVVLSWDDTRHAGIIDGHNLVIHEFAHKLDMQNGVANGYPPLHTGMDHKQWVAALTAGFADFQRRCSDGESIGIDAYGATSPAEFFAVLSEVFFERPGIIHRHYPAVYDQLQQFYRQDPLQQFLG